MFQEFVKYQGHVTHPSRIAEYTGRCFDRAMSEIGPTQLNIPVTTFTAKLKPKFPSLRALIAAPVVQKVWTKLLKCWPTRVSR